MAKAKAQAPETPALLRVYPHPDLAERGEALAGVPADGAEVPYELAQEWLAAGLATKTAPPAPPADEEV